MSEPRLADSARPAEDGGRSVTDAGRPVTDDERGLGDSEFALLLTHDVDRPYKTGQSLYYALAERDPRHLKALHPEVNPWWQFDEIADVEASLGVRSAFYFLREQHLLERDPRDWFDPFYWVEQLGRYDLETPEMLDLLDRLNRGGWEVGLHGSYDSYDDRSRLRREKTMLDAALGEPVTGGRQHHLNLGPETWAYHRELGLKYDASPGSSSEYGFDRYRPFRPFGDEFVVFPLTLMEVALPDPGERFERAWRECESLLEEAADNDAVMSVLWHPRMFCEADFPGYRELYRRVVERALEMGAWVGSPADYYDRMDHPGSGAAGDGDASTAATPRSSDSDLRNAVDRRSVRSEQAEDNKVRTDATTESTG